MLLTMKEQQRIEAIQALMDDRLSAAQTAQVLGRSEHRSGAYSPVPEKTASRVSTRQPHHLDIAPRFSLQHA
jgi:hypothetical protein